MKIIQELYDLKTVCVGGMQIWIFWILENCWNYKKIIEFSQESTILGKLQWSCGKLEPKLSKLGQFWSGQISKLLCTLNVCTPCRTLLWYCDLFWSPPIFVLQLCNLSYICTLFFYLWFRNQQYMAHLLWVFRKFVFSSGVLFWLPLAVFFLQQSVFYCFSPDHSWLIPYVYCWVRVPSAFHFFINFLIQVRDSFFIFYDPFLGEIGLLQILIL